MKKLFLTLALNLLGVTFLFAQVGINNDNSLPDPSAMLDVKSQTKGLLAPRVALSAINVSDPIQSPALGLLVFNTVNAGTPPNNVVVGYYFWNGNRWIQSAAPLGVSLGDLQYWNGSQWITVPAGLPGQFLQMSQANIPVWAGSTFATIITTTPYNISASGAISGGTITSDGGSAITAKGICYNNAPNPTLANFKLAAGSGTNSFSANITGLVANTTYYIRAYATNTAGTVYGNEVVFNTLPEATVPVITTTAISSIAATTATSGGSIINNGGAAVTARGVCWSTSSNPTIAGSKTVNGSGNGGFSSNLSGLTPNTLYYVRAYATNSAGTGYGNELSFTTLCSSSVTASVSITVSANPVCQGASVTFNATPTNGGTSPTYQWKVNGNNAAGATSTSYSYTPAQGDVVTCVMTSNMSCVNGSPATSNAITMTVNPQVTASVTIATSANPVCEGTAVTFTATPVNGGTNPSYQWKVNGNNVQGATTATYQFIPVNNDAVSCTMNSNAACVTGNPAISNTLTMSVTSAHPVSVVIIASENPVNSGTSVTFTAMTTNGGTSPSFQWKVNGVAAGTNSSTFTYIPVNEDSILCIVTSNAICASVSPATSNTIVMIVNSNMGMPCPGIPTVTYGGQTYNTVKIGEQCWFKENLNIGTKINRNQNQANNDVVEKYCYNDLETNCVVYGGLYQWGEMMQYATVNGIQGICPSGWRLPSSTDWTTLESFLGGSSVAGGKMKETGTEHWSSPNFGATNISGFTGLPGGENLPSGPYSAGITYYGAFWSSSEETDTTAYITGLYWYGEGTNPHFPKKIYGYSVRCIKDTCSTYSSTGVSISPSANPVCSDTEVIFTATPTNGGSTPFYQWKVNGVFVGTNSPTYNYVPANGDSIRCIMTSSAPCTSNPASSNTITITVTNAPVAPTSGTHTPSKTQIIWNWNSVQGATGYKWNTTNDTLSAIDLGTATTKTETGLACDSLYICYVWAYNDCGNSEVLSLTQSTIPCSFSCGDSITINHVVGDVAPVTKTITYGTVTNIPGEETKCWITSNLGSDHQATAVNDATEASAGWYWQFNRKQGYKHDGTNRTPNTTWISSINENLDWQITNDPCDLELGLGWRLPTYSEWYNVDHTGEWSNSTEAWFSDLKLHGSGYLNFTNGFLYDRGLFGYLWSKTQNNNELSWLMNFASGYSNMDYNHKEFGFCIRCIKDTCSVNLNNSISISPTSNQVCSGTSVTFSSTITNGGNDPYFQWKLNGISVGTNSPTYTYTPANGDSIKCLLTSSIPCCLNPAISNQIIMLVNPILPVSVSITASANPLISGMQVSLTAVPVNGGDNPLYQWIVNGNNVGTNNSVFSYFPEDGDSIWCLLISNNPCTVNDSSISNTIILNTFFPCTEVPTVNYGGKSYNTVKLGNQCWMRENISFQTDNSYCYDDNPMNCEIYGRLYKWNAATTVCPTGWHLPNDSDWSALLFFLGGETVAGGKMKEQGISHWILPNFGATNSSGFSALPNGYRRYDGAYFNLGIYSQHWSSSEYSYYESYYKFISTYNENIISDHTEKNNAYAVRCLKNCSYPESPFQEDNISDPTQIIWNWTLVSGATGYKWNTINDFSTATEMGTLTTKTEMGLYCNTIYIRYIWAYNECGTSPSAMLTDTTMNCVILPIVTTSPIMGITQTTASGGGNVTSDGGGTVTARGVCWSTSPNPTIADSKTIDGNGNGVFTSSVTGLVQNTLYYVKAYATNSMGTAYGDPVTFSTIAFAIGQTYGGGKIFWLDDTGQHGLIAATSDQITIALWGCYGTTIGGTGTGIGTGQANTTAIVNGCIQSNIAARICNDLVLNGYDDWYLPSKDELNQMYVQQAVIGGFDSTYYWSSSESSSHTAWYQNFGNGGQGILPKHGQYFIISVRAVRAF